MIKYMTLVTPTNVLNWYADEEDVELDGTVNDNGVLAISVTNDEGQKNFFYAPGNWCRLAVTTS